MKIGKWELTWLRENVGQISAEPGKENWDQKY
jgi:hypothetical protein